MLPQDTTNLIHKDHVTNEEVCAKIQQVIGPHKDLLTILKRRKLQWCGHVSCSLGLAKTILQGTVKGGRGQGRQHQGMDRPGVRQVPESSGEWIKWRKLVVKSSVVLQRPSWLRDS